MRFNEYILIILYDRCSYTDHESRDILEMAILCSSQVMCKHLSFTDLKQRY